ncbi:MAG: hypothetical protein C9356_19915 [Oleiphilus sp.]|nr:MAG: hypothetical protein C9356_19915 [Oleiphilus sp.]
MSDKIERLKFNQKKLIGCFVVFLIVIVGIAVSGLISNGTPIVYIVSGVVGVIVGLKVMNNAISLVVPAVTILFSLTLGIKGILGLIVCCGIAYAVSSVDEKITGKIATLSKSITGTKKKEENIKLSDG